MVAKKRHCKSGVLPRNMVCMADFFPGGKLPLTGEHSDFTGSTAQAVPPALHNPPAQIKRRRTQHIP